MAMTLFDFAMSKESLVIQLENELKNHHRKYVYHKKISEGYLELERKTKASLMEVSSSVN